MTTDTVGGVWTYALDLARALVPLGITTDLATFGPLPDPARRLAARAIPGLTLHERASRLEWQSEPWTDLDQAGDWLRTLVRERSPDVIHFNHFAHADVDYGPPKLVVVHSCVRSWYRAVRGHDAPAEWDEYTRRVGRGLRGADVVVAPTAVMLRSAAAEYGLFRQSAVIANGKDVAEVSDATVPKEDFILTAGRLWDEAKNVVTLDRAAADLPWATWAAGDDRGPDGTVVNLNSVRRLGYVDADGMSDWYRRAAIYCLPALYEPFGLSVLEAAHAGCALVLGDIPSLREVWGDAAVYVDPRDHVSVKQTLTGLIADASARARLGRRARARATTFGTGRMAERYRQTYLELMREYA